MDPLSLDVAKANGTIPSTAVDVQVVHFLDVSKAKLQPRRLHHGPLRHLGGGEPHEGSIPFDGALHRAECAMCQGVLQEQWIPQGGSLGAQTGPALQQQARQPMRRQATNGRRLVLVGRMLAKANRLQLQTEDVLQPVVRAFLANVRELRMGHRSNSSDEAQSNRRPC